MAIYVFNLLIHSFMFWLHRVFVALRGPFPVAVSGGYARLSRQWLLSLPGTDSRALELHGLSCSVACEIFPDQGGLKLYPLRWQEDS